MTGTATTHTVRPLVRCSDLSLLGGSLAMRVWCDRSLSADPPDPAAAHTAHRSGDASAAKWHCRAQLGTDALQLASQPASHVGHTTDTGVPLPHSTTAITRLLALACGPVVSFQLRNPFVMG